MVEIVYQLLKMALSKTEKVVASKEVVRTRTQCVLSNSNIRFFSPCFRRDLLDEWSNAQIFNPKSRHVGSNPAGGKDLSKEGFSARLLSTCRTSMV